MCLCVSDVSDEAEEEFIEVPTRVIYIRLNDSNMIMMTNKMEILNWIKAGKFIRREFVVNYGSTMSVWVEPAKLVECEIERSA